MSEQTDIPEVEDIDMVFQTKALALLPKWDDLTDDEKRMRGPFCDAVSKIFFSGGRLEDHGLKIKPGIDREKVYRFVRATLGDWSPKHEHKIGGIGHMLSKWCETT